MFIYILIGAPMVPLSYSVGHEHIITSFDIKTKQ